jgi:hypothetical protein
MIVACNKLKTVIAISTAFVMSVAPLSQAAVELVPAGNRNAKQPNIPGASKRRTQGHEIHF